MKPTQRPRSRRMLSASHVKSWARQCVLLMVCQLTPLFVAAQSVNSPPGGGGGSVTGTVGDFLQLAPFKYIPPISADAVDRAAKAEAAKPKRQPDQQRIVDLSAAGDYQAAGTEGLALISKEKLDDELVLIVANSLAWTGRTKEAIPTYQSLANGKLADQADVGVGNIYRWNGREDEALPLYQKALAANPANADAMEGVEMASRELSPRTLLSFGSGQDSTEERRRSATLNHRWRDSSGKNIMEIETSAVKDTMPGIEATQQDVTFRYQSLNLALKPSFELSLPNAGDNSLYGSVRVKVLDDQVILDGGRVNWGRIATNPYALASHLSAMHAGIRATGTYSFGSLTARVDYFDISDDNTVVTSSVHLASAWRPLGKNFRPFAGVETRGAKYSTTSYWSPDQGSGTVYGGLLGEWGAADWNVYASGQVGFRIYGDAGTSWSATTGGKFWVSRNIALSG
ncbi:MAG: tetratricopeptide repeat protein, partial [Rhodoferax sp.]